MAGELFASPANTTVILTNGTTATFIVDPYENTFTYQWEVDDGDGFDTISGATSATLELTEVTKEQDQYQYRCSLVMEGDPEPFYTDAAVLTVYNGPQLTTFPATNASGVTTATLTCDYVTGEGETITVAVVLPSGQLATICTTISG